MRVGGASRLPQANAGKRFCSVRREQQIIFLFFVENNEGVNTIRLALFLNNTEKPGTARYPTNILTNIIKALQFAPKKRACIWMALFNVIEKSGFEEIRS